MNKWGYIAMLTFTVVGSFWLEIGLKVGVLRRIKRLSASLLPVALIFLGWDAYAIAHKHWRFDEHQMLGIVGPFRIPLEEYLFFIIVPIASIMTLEGVRRIKRHWPVGDGDEL
ncbi:MAG: lycopene cyclase domain-containing protein [bacterium]|nr:lycopene cyclase domain-containing protein [Actinomycetota bacterium]